MRKTNFLQFIILIFLLFNFSEGQISTNARDALILHKQNLWHNANLLDLNNTLTASQKSIDAIYYKLDLTICFDPNLLTGKVTGRYKSKIDALNAIELNFDDHMKVDTVLGAVTGYTHSGQVLTIELLHSFNKDEIIEVTVVYSGVPDPGPRRWFVFDQLPIGADHVRTLSEPYGARYWWPCKDYPADKADSVDVIVTVPVDQLVASNGVLLSDIIIDGQRTFHWHEKYPIATYLVSLAVAPYAHFSDTYIAADNQSMLLDYYVYPGDESVARNIFPQTKQHLDILSHYFGPYPFLDEKYGLAQFGWKSGAMEHQTITSISRVSEDQEYVYVHELGHQWFGDALTCASWTDIWLNEGFASYSEALYAERAGYKDLPTGFESYKAYITNQRYTGPGILYIQDTLNLASVFGRNVYNKGSWFLHMLRGVLGDADFFEALYSYANGELKYSSVRTDDFKNICEQVSGKDLHTFFYQWIYEPYFPIYYYSWEKVLDSNNSLTEIKVNIEQKQTGIVYEMPIDLEFIFRSGEDTTITISNYIREQEYLITLNETPREMLFDPDNWILNEAYNKSGGDFTDQIEISSIFPNPANSIVNIEVIFWGQTKLSLDIYDIIGRKIRRIEPYSSSKIHRSYFEWDGRDQNGNRVAAGIYFIKAINDQYSSRGVKKVILLK